MKVLENWLGNSRKKARKISREGGTIPSVPITKRGGENKSKAVAKKGANDEGKRGGAKKKVVITQVTQPTLPVASQSTCTKT